LPPSQDTHLLKLTLSVVVDLPGEQRTKPWDIVVELQPNATVRDLTDAIVQLARRESSPDYGLQRMLISGSHAAVVPGAFGYLPADVLLSQCGLFDGVLLYLRDRARDFAPELFIDTERAESDLYLVDERGTHRGRATRLPAGVEVMVGSAPEGERTVVVDDESVASTAVSLVNRFGEYVACTLINGEGVHISGARAGRSESQFLLPGESFGFRRDGTDFVGFALTTADGLQHRSPISKIRFDPTARLADPTYPALSEHLSRLPAQPGPPDDLPFPIEQIVIPLLIVAALWIATGSFLSILIGPIAAVAPIVNHRRQQKLARLRYQKQRDEWVKRLEEAGLEQTRLAGLEEGSLLAENPPVERWARSAYRRLAGLWGRTPERKDFMRISLGYGQIDSRYVLKVADGMDLDDTDFTRVMQTKGRVVERDAVYAQLFDVPITADLREYHLGLVGPAELVNDLATDVLMQVVCAQAPGVVGIAALLPASEYARERFDWLKWVPHTFAGSTLLPAARVFAGRDSCNAFLSGMRDLHLERHQYRLDEEKSSYALVVVHEAAETDVALLDELCAISNDLVRVLWLGSSADTTPQLITSVIELQQDDADSQDSTGIVLSGAPALVDNRFRLNLFRAEPVRSVRALAPLFDPRDSGANAGIPRTVPLAAVTPVTDVRYEPAPRLQLGTSLKVPLGLHQSGVFELDLVRDGPHSLIGGTTGSGKSELLQTMTCGLIGRYGATEVNLFLVDFKGGATFAPFEKLPHVVGYVSDLDQRNVNRALAFLRAELRRREHWFARMGNVKEYEQYLIRALYDAPTEVLPRLVVMFDEFATIVQEFERTTMPAVIDIAQRGRSLGVHLVLATQQPSRDVVAPKVRANVNARIALRTLSADDSHTILDRPDATRIPRAMPGRAIACLEGNNLVEFQAAFAGAEYREDEAPLPVRVREFLVDAAVADRDSREDLALEQSSGVRRTHLQQLVGSITGHGFPQSRGSRSMPTALEKEPRKVAWQIVRSTGEDRVSNGSRALTPFMIGVVDLPHKQEQRHLEVDLRLGGVCIAGPNGSGRSTALATIAQQFTRLCGAQSSSEIVCLDGGERLGQLLAEHSIEATSILLSRYDRVTRVIDQLWSVMRSRMAGEETDDRGLAYTGDSNILIVIDGFDILARAFASPLFAIWLSRLIELLAQGRRYGIYAAVGTRSIRDLEMSVAAAMSAIVDLHAHYDEGGVPQEDRYPGFGLTADGSFAQIFVPFPAESNDGPKGDPALRDFLNPEAWREPASLAIRPEPSMLNLGIEEVARLPLEVDLNEEHVLIIGGVRSGRTKLLGCVAGQIHDRSRQLIGFIPLRSSSSASLPGTVKLGADDLLQFADLHMKDDRIAFARARRLYGLADSRLVVLLDDCYAFESHELGTKINDVLMNLFEQAMIQPIAVTTAQAISRCMLTNAMKASGTVVYLRPGATPSDTDDGWRVRNMPFHHRPSFSYRRYDAIVQNDTGQKVVHMISHVAEGANDDAR